MKPGWYIQVPAYQLFNFPVHEWYGPYASGQAAALEAEKMFPLIRDRVGIQLHDRTNIHES